MYWKIFITLLPPRKCEILCMRKQRGLNSSSTFVTSWGNSTPVPESLCLQLLHLTGALTLSLPECDLPGLRPGCLRLPFDSGICTFSQRAASHVYLAYTQNCSGAHLPHFLWRITISDSLCPGTLLCTKDYETYQAPRYLSNKLNLLPTY